MDILQAVKTAARTGKRFYFYHDDGSRAEYSVSAGGLLYNSYDELATFSVDRFLSRKFTFADRCRNRLAARSAGKPHRKAPERGQNGRR